MAGCAFAAEVEQRLQAVISAGLATADRPPCPAAAAR